MLRVLVALPSPCSAEAPALTPTARRTVCAHLLTKSPHKHTDFSSSHPPPAKRSTVRSVETRDEEPEILNTHQRDRSVCASACICRADIWPAAAQSPGGLLPRDGSSGPVLLCAGCIPGGATGALTLASPPGLNAPRKKGEGGPGGGCSGGQGRGRQALLRATQVAAGHMYVIQGYVLE